MHEHNPSLLRDRWRMPHHVDYDFGVLIGWRVWAPTIHDSLEMSFPIPKVNSIVLIHSTLSNLYLLDGSIKTDIHHGVTAQILRWVGVGGGVQRLVS